MQHPDIPFSIEPDMIAGRYVKRDGNGNVEPASTTDYLLMALFIKIDALTAPAPAISTGSIGGSVFPSPDETPNKRKR